MTTLVIGSTCVDVIIRVPEFPAPGQDVNTEGSKFALGGTAFNVAKALQNSNSPFILCSPVGSGLYADFVKEKLRENKIPVFASIPDKENGACWCLVNDKNEHAFICAHKAEYIFDREFYNDVDWKNIDSVYFCGLEMEEATAAEEVDFLTEINERARQHRQNIKFFYDPSSRVPHTKKSLLKKIFALSPVLHLNQTEAFALTKKDTVEEAAATLNEKTKNDLIITIGKDGSYIFEHSTKKGQKVPGVKVNVINTIGCGDAHLGKCIAELKNGASLYDATLEANKYAARIAMIENASM